MLYLTDRTRFRHVRGTKISAMPNFIFASNTFMGLKINAFGVILDFIVFTYNLHKHICCISRTVLDSDMYVVPKYLQCPTLYSPPIHSWGLKAIHLELSWILSFLPYISAFFTMFHHLDFLGVLICYY